MSWFLLGHKLTEAEAFVVGRRRLVTGDGALVADRASGICMIANSECRNICPDTLFCICDQTLSITLDKSTSLLGCP